MFNIECKSEDCRLHIGRSTTTCMYFQPIYDKRGNNTNPDRNITTTEVHCSSCGKSWVVKQRGGEQIELMEVIS